MNSIENGKIFNNNWRTILKEIRVLGSGSFGTVYFVESFYDGKTYVLKETFTQEKEESD